MPRFAIKTPPQHARFSDILEIWQAADQIDLFESAWLFDHFYPIIGDQNGPCLESWVTLTALSQATSRLRIGSMVNGMHSRHPAITAKMAATLDIVSGGRLNLGLGAGWFEPEAAAYGIPLGTVAERMNRFDEAVEVIVGLLSQESTTFHGRYFNLEDARCEPKGPQRPHPPIVIGGAGEKRTLRAVARWAQIWDALRTEPDAWRQKHEVLEEHCAAIGRDPREITCSAHIFTAPDADPGELAGQAARLFALGIDLVIFSLRPPYSVAIVEPLAKALSGLT
jgi:F420-dependent oxidoreductase-like protein